MKTKLAKKFIAMFFTFCMVLSLMPISVFGEGEATEMADFTGLKIDDALNLLNGGNSEAGLATWDNDTKILTLKGVNFTTSATTALRLPDGATVVLADGKDNYIKGGNASVEEGNENNNKIYVCGIETQGALTIKGSGNLFVTAGDHTNTGNAWTYSVGILANGDLNIEGGNITTTGGEVKSGSTAFSYGVEMQDKKNLSVTGGVLNTIGGKSISTINNPASLSFSGGIETYRGDISISGNGKINAKCVEDMEGGGLTYGIYGLNSNLTVSDSAELCAGAAHTISLSNGNLTQTGGKITAVHRGKTGYSLETGVDLFAGKNDFVKRGNVEIKGGTFKTVNGGIYVSGGSDVADNQNSFIVSGGKVNVGEVYGANRFEVLGGTVESQRISSESLKVTDGSLTVREPVHQSEIDEKYFYTSSAIWCGNVTVNGGKLDVAWDWGDYEPIVFPKGEDNKDPVALVGLHSGTATFNGGTSIFNTGCAGNTVFGYPEKITLGTGMVKTGIDSEQKQIDSDVPALITAGDVINEIEIDKSAVDSYEIGDAPKATAVACDGNSKNYYFQECWEELEETDNGLEPVAYWYSDGDAMALVPDDQKITSFEEGKKYVHSIRAIAKGDFVFAGKDTLKVKLNGEDISNSNSVIVSGSNKYVQITDRTINMQAPGKYEITEGAGSSWTTNSNEALTFVANGDISKFVGIKVDGEWVDEENYVVDSGSTVVTLKNEYLKTLSVGEHEITFVYTDGECSTNFEIKEPGADAGENLNSVKTGDASNMLVWISLLATSILTAMILLIDKNKKYNI